MSKPSLDNPEDYVQSLLEQQKTRLCTDPNKLYGYMWYLIRKALKLNQSQMGKLFSSSDNKKGLSKSAYSKIENGQTDINFELIFSFSLNTNINFDHLYQLYSFIIRKADSNGCSFLKGCGYLGFGSQNGMFVSYQNVSKEYWYTDLKDYYKFFLPSDLESIHELIVNMYADKAKRHEQTLDWIAQQKFDDVLSEEEMAAHNAFHMEQALLHLKEQDQYHKKNKS
ncbi:helix-turn-helix domain-containing protein [Acinetobacter indicus]|uniref:Helix-turn-helix transcriptional regulator n=1 Tax=Acinetobacter indicus TaxID=756892 RepID=A0AAW8Z7R0_9GAMM|nr:helix-turn-helix transcriptional regulator [Acinetobacter indicus]MDV4317047.1 helix-turn-helix transcriptional regulator [Acinetobacter indicus]